jgi:outer membrane protein OmpA-like peptidoglycan-associated protein
MDMRAVPLMICAAMVLFSCKSTRQELPHKPHHQKEQNEAKSFHSVDKPLVETLPTVFRFKKSAQVSVPSLAKIDTQFTTITIEEYRLESHLLHSIGFNNSILFTFDKSDLTDINVLELDRFADSYKQNDVGKYLYIVGHTDGHGSQTYNQSLSARRALVVSSLLVRAGIPAYMIRLVLAGEIMPLATNSTEQGRATNRRVEILTANSKELVKAFLREQDCENIDTACEPALLPIIPIEIKGDDILISMGDKEMVSTNTPMLNDLRLLEASLSQDLDATDKRFGKQTERERLSKLNNEVRATLQIPTHVRPEMAFIHEIRKSIILPIKYHVIDK